jgi:hypothetical protein
MGAQLAAGSVVRRAAVRLWQQVGEMVGGILVEF